MKPKKLAMIASILAAFLGSGMPPSLVAAQGMEYDCRLRDGGIRSPDAYGGSYERRQYRDPNFGRAGCGPRQALVVANRWLYEPRIRWQNRMIYFIEGYGKQGGNRGRPDSARISTAYGCDRR